MTIPKRSKNKRMMRREINLASSLEKDYIPPEDKMVRNYPRICPICNVRGYSARCGCGRITIINKGG